MSKSLSLYFLNIALVTGLIVSPLIYAILAPAQSAPLTTPKEPPKPLITYIPLSSIVLLRIEGEPDAARLACNSLKGKGELALTFKSLVFIVPINCPEKPVAPFE